MRGAALGLNILHRMQPRMVVFPQAARIKIDHVVDDLDPFLHLENLVDLLLIGGHNEPCAAILQHIGHLFGHRVLIQRHRDSADLLCCHHGPVKRRTVAPDDRNVIALFNAQRQQPQRNRTDFLRGRDPAPALPDPEFLLTIRRVRPEFPGIPRQQGRNRVQRAVGRRLVCQSISSRCRLSGPRPLCGVRALVAQHCCLSRRQHD